MEKVLVGYPYIRTGEGTALFHFLGVSRNPLYIQMQMFKMYPHANPKSSEHTNVTCSILSKQIT